MGPTKINDLIPYQVIGHTKKVPRTTSMDNGFYCIQSKDILVRWCSAEKLQLQPIVSRIDFSKLQLLIIGIDTTDSTNFIGITTVKKINETVTLHSGEININSGAPREPAPGYSTAFLAINKNIRLNRVRIEHEGLLNLNDLYEKMGFPEDANSKGACQKPHCRMIVNRASGPLFQ